MKLLMLLMLSLTLVFGAVDINTATQKELVGLDGIGAKKAKAIIAYRDKKCFKSISELSNVKGIGKKLIAKNKTNIRVSKCKK